jgi:CelD/BcsL family acetyltransferase involved in cellulose biosynthesis
MIQAKERTSAIQVQVMPARRLTPDLCAKWREIQEANPLLASPYFRPEFTQLVAEVRTDVEVAVIEQAGKVVGFFPFQRTGFSRAQPVAGRLSDFHGVIAAEDFVFDPLSLIASCRVSSWRFDHLLVSQTSFAPYMWTRSRSPYVDLSRGFQAYEAERKADNSELSTIKRKLNKLAREVGPLRLEWNSTDRDALTQLLCWKSQQYERTGLRDVFSFAWIRAFLDRLFELRTPELSGVLACLYAGDRLVAAHLGMSSRHVLHWWFPSYDRAMGRYSPGLCLIYRITQLANEHGITRLDFGKGDEEYKFRLASGADEVAEGSVDLRASTRLMRRTWQTTRDWVRSSPLHRPTEAPLRWLRRMRDWLSFR